jgi:hypothetical protein
MTVANTLAYYNMATTTTIKMFIVQAQGSLAIKLFMAVMYYVP